jgi:fumarate reductase flavoprotein subunit
MKQLKADIVIISAGTAGLAAAVAAAEGGASVISFEKAATTGGTGNMGMGPLAVESRLQRLKQIALTREEAFNIFMDYTHWRVDARLVKAYIDKSASTIDWLEKMGVEFIEPAANFPGSRFTWHLIKPAGGGRPGPNASSAMMKCLTSRAQELGVKIYLQTPVKKIIKEKGKIAGVVAEDRNGEEIQASAKAVIIATGGFGDNTEWIKKYTGYEWGRDIFSFRIPGLVGDGIRMAWEVGAGKEGLNMELTCGIPAMSVKEGQQKPTMEQAFRQPNLLVNLLGERFMNEEVMANPTFTGNAVSRQKNHCAFIIFDSAAKKCYEEEGYDIFGGHTFPSEKLENLDAELTKIIELSQQNCFYFMADSIEELATKTGINLPAFKKTLAEYNQACETGRDELFHKKPKYLRSVKQPRFYAGKLFPGGYGSLGGIKINYKTEVVTKDHEPIPGLYAAGTDACSIYADSYVFILPGNTMSFALNSGRIAGENAARYVKSAGK